MPRYQFSPYQKAFHFLRSLWGHHCHMAKISMLLRVSCIVLSKKKLGLESLLQNRHAYMKRGLLIFFLLLTIQWAKADEGMWLPYLLGQQVYNDMVKKGLKLTKEQLYSINKASVKDAIIIFGGGCTGEIVSSEGLLFTNHHCGYDAIANAS